MVIEESELVEQLMTKDSEFRRLVLHHRALDREAEQLSRQTCLIPDEEDRLRLIKKQKLALLDHIQLKLQDFSGNRGNR